MVAFGVAFRAMCFKIFMGKMFNDLDCRTDSGFSLVYLSSLWMVFQERAIET